LADAQGCLDILNETFEVKENNKSINNEMGI